MAAKKSFTNIFFHHLHKHNTDGGFIQTIDSLICNTDDVVQSGMSSIKYGCHLMP